MKVYYNIPDTDDRTMAAIYKLHYDNLKLRLLLAVTDIKSITDKEKGIVFIDRLYNPDRISFRYEGWTKATEALIKHCIVQGLRRSHA